MRRWIVLGLALVATPAEADLALAPCGADLPATALCGTVPVPEVPGDPASRVITLDIVRLPATQGDGGAPPLVVLAGEPGDDIRLSVPAVPEVNAGRDVILLGGRGTGSSALDCPLYPTVAASFDDLLPVATVQVCRDSRVADLTRYTTAEAVDDLEAARLALGVERIDLFASGRATRIAMAYAGRYGDRVRALALRGAAPADVNRTITASATAERVFFQLFVRCARDVPCSKAYVELKRAFTTTLGRLAEAPAEAIVDDPATGQPATVVVDHADFALGLRAALDDPASYAEVPFAIAAAADGDFVPAATLILAARQAFDARAVAAHLSAVCADDGPGLAAAELAASRRPGDLGDVWAMAYRDACAVWLQATPPLEAEAFDWDGPLLLLSGEVDPTADPDRAAALLSGRDDAAHVVFAGPVHGTPEAEACVDTLLAAFLDDGGTEALPVACARTSRLLDFRVPE